MIKKAKLSKKSVKAYEKMSGFKTTGNVTLHLTDDKTLGLLDSLLSVKL